MTGRKVNHLTVIGLAHGPRPGLYWQCKCECGKVVVVYGTNIRSSHTKSCGCINLRSWTGHGEISGAYWSNIKSGARSRGLVCDITIQDAWNAFTRQNRRCALTGVELQLARLRGRDLQTASLDRIDSSLGYSINNIQWVHKDVNIMKGDLSDSQFVRWCFAVARHSHSS